MHLWVWLCEHHLCVCMCIIEKMRPKQQQTLQTQCICMCMGMSWCALRNVGLCNFTTLVYSHASVCWFHLMFSLCHTILSVGFTWWFHHICLLHLYFVSPVTQSYWSLGFACKGIQTGIVRSMLSLLSDSRINDIDSIRVPVDGCDMTY